MVPFHIHIVIKGFWQHAQWNATFLINMCVYNIQELMPYMGHKKKKKKIFIVCAKIWTRISWINEVCINQLCHEAAQVIITNLM